MIEPKAVMGRARDEPGRIEALGDAVSLPTEVLRPSDPRVNALPEVTDAVLCADGPVRTSVDLAWCLSAAVATA